MRTLMVSLFFVEVCDVLQLVVVMTAAVLFYMVTAVYTAPWSSSLPPRVEVVSSLVRQDYFVPSRRFREGGL